jgi:hypothetical protein
MVGRVGGVWLGRGTSDRSRLSGLIYADGAADAFAFYNEAVGAQELFRIAAICGSLGDDRRPDRDPADDDLYGEPANWARPPAPSCRSSLRRRGVRAARELRRRLDL